ncbi:MAG: DUF6084 family protein [Acidobacteriota bacterium]
MIDLSFQVTAVEPVTFAAAPLLVFKLGITEASAERAIHSVVLRCQIQIESTRRRYSTREQAELADLFGEPERWSQTLRNMLWTHASTVAPSFTGSTVVDLQVPCTFDFNVASTKYFYGLQEGEIPLALFFSGTVFFVARDGALQVAQIPWNKEVRYRLPLKAWKSMMDHYYPNSAWLCLRRDVFERLYQFKVQRGLPTWEETFEEIFPQIEEGVY